jgi:hypothetical protein
MKVPCTQILLSLGLISLGSILVPLLVAYHHGLPGTATLLWTLLTPPTPPRQAESQLVAAIQTAYANHSIERIVLIIRAAGDPTNSMFIEYTEADLFHWDQVGTLAKQTRYKKRVHALAKENAENYVLLIANLLTVSMQDSFKEWVRTDLSIWARLHHLVGLEFELVDV